MGRVINPETAGKQRQQMMRAISIALRELMQQREPNDTTRDIAAFIALALEAIAETIETTVGAWEKRGYWLKSDRFRLDWEWAGKYGAELREATMREDWAKIAVVAGQVGEKVQGVKVPQRHKLGRPWDGAWMRLVGQEKDRQE